MKNKLSDVRNIMIEAMESLLHPEENSNFDVDKAKALADIGKVIVESAKVEVQAINIAAKYGIPYTPTGFIDVNVDKNKIPEKIKGHPLQMS